LLRLNLKTGDFKTILPDQPGAYAFALSPDDQLLVYSTSEKPELIHVVNMDSGDEQQIVIENGIGVSGRFVWDPTSTKVVFATGFGPGGDEPRDDISSTSIYILTISYMHAQPIVYQDSRELLPWWNLYADGYWIDANTICLLARSNAFRDWDGVFALNIQTGILTNAPTTTATPYPTTESQ
jgi:Tol biopolymer transport system component